MIFDFSFYTCLLRQSTVISLGNSLVELVSRAILNQIWIRSSFAKGGVADRFICTAWVSRPSPEVNSRGAVDGAFNDSASVGCVRPIRRQLSSIDAPIHHALKHSMLRVSSRKVSQN